jgi:hypothetical protein
MNISIHAQETSEACNALDRAKVHLTEVGLIDSPGAVLYSGSNTLKRGPVYLLGLNPGGAEGATLRDSIEACRRQHNAYLDEQWSPGGHLQPKGGATLQRRIQQLCAAMGYDTRAVPASNLVFTRSTRIGTHLDFSTAKALCLPVHTIFLETIQPDFLMTFGSIDNFQKSFTVSDLQSRSAEHGTWMAHRGSVRINGRKVAFGNVPHMSLWASDKRLEVVGWAIERGAKPEST